MGSRVDSGVVIDGKVYHGYNPGEVEIAKELIVMESRHYRHAEDIQMLLCDMIASAFM